MRCNGVFKTGSYSLVLIKKIVMAANFFAKNIFFVVIIKIQHINNKNNFYYIYFWI